MGVDFSELEVAFVANFVEPNKVLIVVDARARRPCAPPGNPS